MFLPSSFSTWSSSSLWSISLVSPKRSPSGTEGPGEHPPSLRSLAPPPPPFDKFNTGLCPFEDPEKKN